MPTELLRRKVMEDPLVLAWPVHSKLPPPLVYFFGCSFFRLVYLPSTLFMSHDHECSFPPLTLHTPRTFVVLGFFFSLLYAGFFIASYGFIYDVTFIFRDGFEMVLLCSFCVFVC